MKEVNFKFVNSKDVIKLFMFVTGGIAVIMWLIGLWDLIHGHSFNSEYIFVSLFIGVYSAVLFTPIVYFAMDKAQVKIIEEEDKLTLEYSAKSIAFNHKPRTLVLSKGDLLHFESKGVTIEDKRPMQLKMPAPKIAYVLSSGNDELSWTTPIVPIGRNKRFNEFLAEHISTMNKDTNTYRF